MGQRKGAERKEQLRNSECPIYQQLAMREKMGGRKGDLLVFVFGEQATEGIGSRNGRQQASGEAGRQNQGMLC